MKLSFEEFGDASTRPVIILHGFFASSRNWRQIAKKLAESCHVYVLDLRNHGSSPHSSEMDYPIMAKDLVRFMTEHGLQKASIVGHSMGGKVAMWFALNYPQQLENLIIADISPVSYQHSFDKIIGALKKLPLEQISNRKQADDFLADSIDEISYRQFLLQNLQLKEGQYSWRIDLDVFYQTADNIIAFPDIDSIDSFANEALFIMGGDSSYTDENAIFSCFPKAHIVELEGANHWLHVDKPLEFCESVRLFLEKK